MKRAKYSKLQRHQRASVRAKAELGRYRLESTEWTHPTKGMTIEETVAWNEAHGLVGNPQPKQPEKLHWPAGWQGISV